MMELIGANHHSAGNNGDYSMIPSSIVRGGGMLLKAVSQAAGKISIPQSKRAINEASLKVLKEASKAGNVIARHINDSIENGQLSAFFSKVLKVGEHMFSVPAILGRDSDDKPTTHKPVLKFKTGKDEDLDLTGVYMQGPEEELNHWDPSSPSGPAQPTSAEPHLPPADNAHLPRRPPPGAGLGSTARKLNERFQAQNGGRGKPVDRQPSEEEVDPPLPEALQRDPEPDELPHEEAPPAGPSALPADHPKPKTLNEVLGEITKGAQETSKEYLKSQQENAKGISYSS
jgi:hypothetical protein